MKKLLAIMAIAAIGFTSCKKDKEETPSSGGSSLTVEQKNRGILIDFSETWCPPCGAYGGPGFDASLALEGTQITAIKVYGSSTPSSMNSPISNGFASAYGVSGVPDFWFNNTQQNTGGGVYSSSSSNYNWVSSKATAFAAEPVVAAHSEGVPSDRLHRVPSGYPRPESQTRPLRVAPPSTHRARSV